MQALEGLRVDEPVAVSAPPTWVQEEATIRDRSSDRAALESVLDGLALRAWRRLRPFDLQAGAATVEVRRPDAVLRRSENASPGIDDEATIRELARSMAEPLLEPAGSVRAIQFRLSRLSASGSQPSLFPKLSGAAR